MQQPNIKLAFEAAKLPIIGLIILEVLWYGFEIVPGLSFLAGDFLFLIKYGLFFWAGYRAAKMSGFDIPVVLIAGALAGIAVEVVDFIFSILMYSGSISISYWVGSLVEYIVIAAVIAFLGYLLAVYQDKQTEHPES